MARGNCIVVSSEPQGKHMEGILGAGITASPGVILQIDYSIALKGGRHTFKLFNRGADGKRPAGGYWVLREDYLQGKPVTSTYAAGERVFLYAPMRGEELNLLLGDVAGTGDTHAVGEMLMVDDTTGKLVASTGTPETEVATLKEAVTAPVADTLAWCQWNG